MIWVWLLVAVIICFVLSAPIQAYIEVKSRPKEPMFYCERHGHMRKGFALQLGPVLYCPICYQEKMKAAAKVITK